VSSGVSAPASAKGGPATGGPATGEARALALADLDAAHAILFGLSGDDLEHVLSTFTALRARELRQAGRFVTAERVLAAYEALSVAASPSDSRSWGNVSSSWGW